MSDRVDEWLMSHLTEFDEKQFQSITKGNLDLGELDDEESKKAQEEAEKQVEGVVERVKTVLGDKVEDVKFTHRLTDSQHALWPTNMVRNANAEINGSCWSARS